MAHGYSGSSGGSSLWIVIPWNFFWRKNYKIKLLICLLLKKGGEWKDFIK